MKEIHLERKEINYEEFIKRTALVSDVNTHIKEDVIIYHKGEPVILYLKMDSDITKYLRWAVKTIKYTKALRTQGLKVQHEAFGFNPRNPVRMDYCRVTKMAREFPKQHLTITDFAENIHHIYNQYFPEIYQKHIGLVEEKVLGEWKLGNTPFTSGIVNKNNALKYHTDSGNFKGVLSNMVALRKGVDGGHLVIPEFDISLEIADNSLTIFNGQEILHGVSPFEKTQPDGYRYTAVYYSLEQMWKCEPISEEIIRIQATAKERMLSRRDPEVRAELQKHWEKTKEKKEQKGQI